MKYKITKQLITGTTKNITGYRVVFFFSFLEKFYFVRWKIVEEKFTAGTGNSKNREVFALFSPNFLVDSLDMVVEWADTGPVKLALLAVMPEQGEQTVDRGINYQQVEEEVIKA